MIALIGFVALVAVAAVDLLEQIDPYVGVVVPLIVARFVRAEAQAGFKQATTIGLAVVLAVSAAWLSGDLVDMQPGDVAVRLLAAVGEAQAVYVAVSAVVGRSMNELPVFRPGSGLG